MLAITTLTSTDIPTDQQPDGPANECPKLDLDRALSRPESCLFTRKNAVQNPGQFRSGLLIGLLGSLYAFAFPLVTGST